MIEPTAILPLVPVKPKHQKQDLVALKLRVNPGSNQSTTFEKSYPILNGQSTVREVVNFRRELRGIWRGLVCDNAVKKQEIVFRLIEDTAEAAYLHGRDMASEAEFQRRRQEAYDNAAGNEAAKIAARDAVNRPALNEDMVFQAINYMTTQLVPRKCLATIKRWLRRKCRKPADMSIRDYIGHLHRINQDEIPELPPNFNLQQSLADEELIDIVLWAIPNSWKRELDRQGVEVDNLNIGQLQQMLESIELSEISTEGSDNNNNSNKSKSNASNKKAKTDTKKTNSKSNDSKQKFCVYHGKNATHTSDECKALKALADSTKDSKNKSSDNKKSVSFKKNDNNNNKKSTGGVDKKELKAMLKEVVAAELNSISRKRKADDAEINMADIDFDQLNLSNAE